MHGLAKKYSIISLGKIENIELFPKEMCIIEYTDDYPNLSSFISESIKKIKSEYLLILPKECELLSLELLIEGDKILQTYPLVMFIYSDGYIVGKNKQTIMLPTFQNKMLDYNKLVINMPLVIRTSFSLELNTQIKSLFSLMIFKQLCERYIGYHLAKITYSVINFSSDISNELNIIYE